MHDNSPSPTTVVVFIFVAAIVLALFFAIAEHASDKNNVSVLVVDSVTAEAIVTQTITYLGDQGDPACVEDALRAKYGDSMTDDILMGGDGVPSVEAAVAGIAPQCGIATTTIPDLVAP